MRLLLACLVAAQPALAGSIERLPEGRLPPVARQTAALPKLGIPNAGGHALPVLPAIPVLDSAVNAVLPGQIGAGLSAPQAALVPAGPQTPQAALEARLEPIAEAVAGDLRGLGGASSEASAGSSEREVRLLQGAPPEPSAGALALEPAPAAPSGLSAAAKLGASSEHRRAVKLMMWAAPTFKVGAEVVTLSMPLLVMKNMGGATMVAALVIVYQVAQAVFGGFTPALTKRASPSRVLAGSVLAQGLLVAGLLGLGAYHALTHAAAPLSPWLVFPVYGLVGGAIGIADTCRRLIPSLLFEHDEQALREFNARLHRRYEIAGVIGSAAGGALIFLIGPLYAMLLQPPAYAAAAWLLWKIKYSGSSTTGAQDSASWRDVFRGAKRVVSDSRFRWLAAAMILPQIIHRVFENLLLPVYAKTLLGAGALAAVLLTASNLGEWGGASLLLKRSSRYPGPSTWVRWGALGILAAWMLPLVGGQLPVMLALGLLVPAIFVFSSTWAGSQLSLDSDVQRSVPRRDQAGVMSFLNGLFIAGTALASFALGRLLDGLGVGPAFFWIVGAFTVVGVLVYLASRRLKPQSSTKP